MNSYVLEFGYPTNPANADTDGDGYSDGEEMVAGTSPVDPASYPIQAIIVAQPVNQSTSAGQTATFGVTAAGTAPLTYQWCKDGVAVLNATNASVALNNVQTNQAGNYTVVITNAYGSVTSSVAALTVNRLAQTITFAALPGKRVDDGPFSLAASASSGLTVSYSSSDAAVATMSGNTVTIIGIGSTTIAASQAGDATYLPAADVSRTLAVAGIPPGISSQPAGLTLNVTSNAAFSVTGTGTAPLVYQWRKNGADLVGETGTTLGLVSVQTNQVGSYTVVITNTWGSVTSSVAVLTVNRLAQTVTFAALPGKRVDDGPFSLAATSSSGLPVNYSSSDAGVATVSSSTVTIVGIGSTTITASQPGDATYLPATDVGRTLAVGGLPPLITAPPISLATNVTANAGFLVTATGTAPLAYQWVKEGVAVLDATNASLVLSNVQTNQAGGYAVVITNAYGSVTSSVAALTVNTPLAGRVVAWGYNDDGQSTVPAAAQGGVIAIAAGLRHTMALKTNGSVVSWGLDFRGLTTVPVAAQTDVIAIAAGDYHAVALRSDGSVILWGSDLDGQSPVPVAAQSGVVAIAAGYGHTLALKSDGSVVAWGLNSYGQANVPAAAQSGVIAIAAAEGHSIALKSDRSVVAWGWNNTGQTNVPAAAQSGVVAIAGGANHTVALKEDGSVVAWGVAGAQTTVPTAAQSGVVAIACGTYHTFAIKSDGSLVMWGANNWGQTAIPAEAQNGVLAAEGGAFHSVALIGSVAGLPPTISSLPAGLTVNATSNATFNVGGTGTAPLAYQWVKDGVMVLDATNASLVLNNVQTNQAGGYAVVITNAYGSVTSSVAALTVNRLAQTITFGALPGKRVDDGAFSLAASASSGLPVAYSSSDAGVATVSGNTVTITGIGSTTLTASQAGDSIYLPAADVSRTLAVAGIPPGISSQPTGLTLNVTSNAAFSVTGTGTAPLVYQWRKNGADLVGETGATLSLGSVQTNHTGNYTVVITNTWGSMTSSVAVLTVNRLAQTITFAALPGKRVDDGPFSLAASASSGLPVAYSSSDAGVATVSGNTVTITGIGSTTITASQAGDSTYLPVSVDRTLAVAGIPPVISSQPAGLTLNVTSNAAFSVMGTGTAPLAFQWRKNGADLVGETGTTLGLVSVQTNQAGNYTVVVTNAWGSVTSSVAVLTVNRLAQTVTFAALPGKRVDDGPFTLAASASSGLPVAYSSSDAGVATVSGNTVTITGIGSTTITASQAGDSTYLPVSVDRTLAVAGIPPVISSQPAGLTLNVTSNAAFSVTATGTAPLAFQWRKNGADLVGETGTTLGLVSVQTNQAGNYSVVITNAWGSVTSSVAVLTVNRLAQTITFAALPGKRVDDGPFTLAASASSGLPVAYSSSDAGVATVSGNTVTIVGIGSATITASQAGDATYLPASVNRTLAVAGIPPSIIGQPTGQTVEVTGIAAFNVTAAGTAPLIYQWRRDGVDLVGSTEATLGLVNVQTNQAGNYTVVVTNSWGSITSSVAALTVNQLVQTITFGALPLKRVDDASFALSATASSGLSVVYSSSVPSVATVSGNTVTLTGVGSTVITASQPGDATYLPAGSVSQTLVVSAPPSITTPPVGQSFTLGSGLTLSVNAGGTGPLFYQWQFNGTNLAGATNPTLTLTNLMAANAGAYRVVIANAVGTATTVPVDLYFYGDLKFMATTVLAGTVGQQFRVDYADVLVPGTTNWLVLTNLTLPSSPFVVVDYSSAGQTKRFYRAIPVP